MGRQIAYLGMAMGLCLAMVSALSLAPGCYNVPQPVCGFFCGADNACPDDYTCSNADNRCHLNGSAPMMCSTHDAGPIDTIDVPLDVPVDGNVPPALVGTTPAFNATGVNVATLITATFTEEVVNVSNATFTLLQGTTPIAGTVTYTIGSHVAQFHQAYQLAANTTYIATLTNGITDVDGAPFPNTAWTFTTGADTVAPMVAMTIPAANGTGVAVNSTVTVRFDEAVTGVSATTFTLMDGATPISGTVIYSAGTKTATFTPDAQLPGNTVLTATLTAGITDLATNALSGAPVSWTFTTAADTVAPSVQSSTPPNGSANAPTGTTITVVFDEPVLNVDLTSFVVDDGAAVAGTLTSGMAGRAWTFTPSAALAAAAVVTVTLSTAITDVAANPLAAPVTLAFMTQ